MKVRLLIAMFALAALAVSASAQDPGDPDTLRVDFTHVPDMSADDSLVVFTVTFVVDVEISNASSGMGWDFVGFEIDSVVWSPEGLVAFNLARLTWANGSLDSTNSQRRFQCTGLTMDANGLSAPAVVATYYGHVNQWADGDAITISQNAFTGTGFTDMATNVEFAPVWAGNPVIADVNAMGMGNLPTQFDLAQNYPNPFNPTTIITFDLPVAQKTNLTVFNVLGQKVATLVDEELAADRYEVEWNGTSDGGNHVASGIYFYRLSAGDKVLTKKMMMLK